jgi:FimV-like protein
MNNLNLGHYPLVKLSLSVFILLGVSATSKADTLYGPLKAGETLSSIVNENYLVSPFEDAVIMREIFRLNPQAFIYNNMGLVKQGVMLTLPSDATIRRSRGGSVTSGSITTVAPVTTTATQATPNPVSISSSLNETLTQVRNERDQAKLQLKRLQTESLAQSEALNARIEQLDSDNQSTTRQLNTAQSEITQLKLSLESTQEENALLVTKAQTAPARPDVNGEITKQLEENELLLTKKQQQITELEASVAELKAAAESINNSHDDAISQLRSEYKILESKLETTAGEVSKSTNDSEAKIDELNLQHQQALTDLKVDFEKRIADQTNLQQKLESEIEAANAAIESTGVELTSLRSANSELEIALAGSEAKIDLIENEKAEADENLNTPMTLTQTDTIETLLTGPVTKELLANEMGKSVAFPLWGLLLGFFALGFTSLMMLFTRSRKPAAQVAQNITHPENNIASKSETENEELVFRAADENALPEPDVETLRVPPRRDPSRVAILDPSMVATTTVATAAVAATSSTSVDIETEASTEVPPLTPYAATEASLKLLLAETYVEINDIPAANEILKEVQLEGDNNHRTTAGKLLAQINQS